MWQGQEPSPVEERDRGLRRLGSWTRASVAIAAGMVGLFSLLAASNFPGHSAAAQSPSPSSSSSSSSPDPGSQPSFDQGNVQPQSPPSGFFGSGSGGGGLLGGRGSVSSGGS